MDHSPEKSSHVFDGHETLPIHSPNREGRDTSREVYRLARVLGEKKALTSPQEQDLFLRTFLPFAEAAHTRGLVPSPEDLAVLTKRFSAETRAAIQKYFENPATPTTTEEKLAKKPETIKQEREVARKPEGDFVQTLAKAHTPRMLLVAISSIPQSDDWSLGDKINTIRIIQDHLIDNEPTATELSSIRVSPVGKLVRETITRVYKLDKKPHERTVTIAEKGRFLTLVKNAPTLKALGEYIDTCPESIFAELRKDAEFQDKKQYLQLLNELETSGYTDISTLSSNDDLRNRILGLTPDARINENGILIRKGYSLPRQSNTGEKKTIAPSQNFFTKLFKRGR